MLEHLAANVVHGGLYVMMLGMAATGVSMGYYGGRGLPFFWTSFPGVAKPGSPECAPTKPQILNPEHFFRTSFPGAAKPYAPTPNPWPCGAA